MTGQNERKKQVKHYHEPGDFHELTFSCYGRMALLVNDDWRRRLSRYVDEACAEHSFQLVAFVYMPEHVHLLVYPTLPKPEIGHFLARLKQPFSKEIKQILVEAKNNLLQRLTISERPGKFCFRYWQEGPGYDRNLYTPKALEGSVNYFHDNPVERKLCSKAIDWKWSSARYYLLEPPKQQFDDLPHVHGLPPGALDRGQSR